MTASKLILNFRKVKTTTKFNQIIQHLKRDVENNNGSASEVIDMHGSLHILTACKVPWGALVINNPSTYLEVLAWHFAQEE